MKPAPLLVFVAVASALVWTTAGHDAGAQNPAPRDGRFAGLEWTFARIRYQGSKLPGLSGCDTYDECWTIDYPAAEQNLSRRVKTVTAIKVNDPVVIDLDFVSSCFAAAR
jgi:hypothetical protein